MKEKKAYSLGISIVRRLTQSENNVVKPEFPCIVETDFVCPQADLIVTDQLVVFSLEERGLLLTIFGD